MSLICSIKSGQRKKKQEKNWNPFASRQLRVLMITSTSSLFFFSYVIWTLHWSCFWSKEQKQKKGFNSTLKTQQTILRNCFHFEPHFMLKIKLKTFWDVLQQHHAKSIFNSKRENLFIKLKSRHTPKHS